MIPLPTFSGAEQKAQDESSMVSKIFVSPPAVELGPGCGMMATSDMVREEFPVQLRASTIQSLTQNK